MYTNVDLSFSQQSSLIKLYHAQDVLWDSSLPGYKDQNLRTIALESIRAAFHAQWNITLEMQDLKTKIQSYRSSVSREMTKRDAAVKNLATPEDYTPSYAHWHELQFLTDVIKKRDAKPKVALPTVAPDPVKSQGGEEVGSSLLWLTGAPPSSSLPPLSPAGTPGIPYPQILFCRTQSGILPLANQSPVAQPLLATQPTVALLSQPSSTQSEPNFPQASPSSTTTTATATTTPQLKTLKVEAMSPTSEFSPHPESPAPSDEFQPPPEQHPPAGVSQDIQQQLSTLQAPTPVYVSTQGQNKRGREAEDSGVHWGAIGQHVRNNKKARAGSRDCDEDYTVWAKNLVQDIKKVRSENKRTVLQIQINRLVQDEILKQIEEELTSTD